MDEPIENERGVTRAALREAIYNCCTGSLLKRVFRPPGQSENLDPAGSIVGLIGTTIETDDLGAAQAAGKADRQNRLVG